MNRNLTAIVVDDEQVSRDSLEYLLQKLDDVDVVGSFSSAIDAKAFLTKTSVDVIFLDVEMPDLSGIEFLAIMDNLPSIILTTSSKEYAVDAFEYKVTDYLVKPVGLKRLIDAIKRISKQEAESEPNPEKEIFVRSDGKHVKIVLNDLWYVETMDDYVILRLENETKHIVHSTLSGMEEKLPNSQFQKTHRSFIINLSKISAIEENQVVLGKTKIPVSRAYRPILKQRLNLS
ncbi:MAG: response regulator transcription factor [Bacteroidetes bacterium]|nr:response regulator transcription factor [Bacteroidota bacterium]